MRLTPSQLSYLILASIIALGAVLRGLSLITNGLGALLDLDPFHSLRAVESIMTTGNVPKFDPLSSAPNGTSYAFATSQGYYGMIGSLGLLSGISPGEALAISPVIFFCLELLSIFVITQLFSKSIIAALFAAFFATSLVGWSAISILGGDPVAENLGAVMFLIVMALTALLIEHPSYILVGLIGFLDGASIEAHPVTYYFLNLTLGAMVISLLISRQWRNAWALLLGAVASLYSIALIQIGGTGLQEAGLFSQSAFWLATLSHFYTIDNSILIYETGLLVVLLAGACIISVLIHRVARFYLLIAWTTVLYIVILIGEFAVYTPYGALVENIPFSAPLTLSHRVMPYLPPVLCILAGVAVGVLLLPGLTGLATTWTVRLGEKRLASIIVVAILCASSFQLVQAYQFSSNYASNFDLAPTYSGLYSWISGHTNASSIFAANDVSIGVYIKALDNRAVFFTTSQEDLTVKDLNQRAILQTCLYLPMCDANNTEQMVRAYRISYAIIITPALLVNQNSSSFVSFNYFTIASQYLTWFGSRPGFVQLYSDSNSAVFAV